MDAHPVSENKSCLSPNTPRTEFLRECGDVYGCQGAVELARSRDLSRLRESTYLDFAGAVPYTDSQLEETLKNLSSRIHFNPHSAIDGSNREEDAARQATLEMCGVSSKTYDVIFTSGATEALRMVGDSFPWLKSSVFAYTQDNHNSVVGIRELALDRGAAAMSGVVRINREGAPEFTQTSEVLRRSPASEPSTDGPHLFAFPLESNFNGARYNPELVNAVSSNGMRMIPPTCTPPSISSDNTTTNQQEGTNGAHFSKNWLVVLDAAKACGTRPPDLRKHPAHFVAISFYKIFGYPTGLGALLVRRDVLGMLRNAYFGGGTLEMVVPNQDIVKRKEGHKGWEHGTSNFLAIAALRTGFDRLQQLGGFGSIDRHACALAKWLSKQMIKLKHSNGSSACDLYHPGAINFAHIDTGDHPDQFDGGGAIVGQGPVVSFNLLASDGSWVGYSEVMRLAELHSIYLRAGRFCNPGACALWMGLQADDFVSHHRTGHVCGDSIDLIDGKPTGAIRASLGWCSTFDDVQKLLWFLENYFVESAQENECWDALHLVEGGQQEASHNGQARKMVPNPRLLSTPNQSQEETRATITENNPNARFTPSLNMLEGGRAISLIERTTGKIGHSASVGETCAISDEGQSAHRPNPWGGVDTGNWRKAGHLKTLVIFPIKSCGAQAVDSWSIDSGGLLYDRHWALLDVQGEILTIGKHPEMACIKPRLDLKTRTLTISHVNRPNSITVSIDQEVEPCSCPTKGSSKDSARQWCSEAISSWLESVLSKKCTLSVFSGSNRNQPKCGVKDGSIQGFSNKGGVSLISTGSVLGLEEKLSLKSRTKPSEDLDMMRFRMNMVVDVGVNSHTEDRWGVFGVGDCRFRKSEGCARCDVVVVNSDLGVKDGKEVLLTLAEYRRDGGRVKFGTICVRESGFRVAVGDPVWIQGSSW
ncbi:hypothetical protein BSKO_03836 [Bryopsis sp. KO-2023]|nr:hypothetical protein BSKO_03836 [Bryopsis sp. KO-2023]